MEHAFAYNSSGVQKAKFLTLLLRSAAARTRAIQALSTACSLHSSKKSPASVDAHALKLNPRTSTAANGEDGTLRSVTACATKRVNQLPIASAVAALISPPRFALATSRSASLQRPTAANSVRGQTILAIACVMNRAERMRTARPHSLSIKLPRSVAANVPSSTRHPPVATRTKNSTATLASAPVIQRP